MVTRCIIFLLATSSVACADNGFVRIGFTLFGGGSSESLLRASMPMRLVEEKEYALYPDAIGLTVLAGERPRIGLGFLAQLAALSTGFVIPSDLSIKLQYPFFLANFRAQGNFTRYSFAYFKQVTDVFVDGVYSESSMGIGIVVKGFELYGGGSKALLDPFGLPDGVEWRMGVSR